MCDNDIQIVVITEHGMHSECNVELYSMLHAALVVSGNNYSVNIL
jgi:hypothetical protein